MAEPTDAPPRTRYAWLGDISIAWQMQGEGPHDLILVPGSINHIELFHELPGYSAFLRGCAGFSRVVTFDRRGQGLSSGTGQTPSLDERMDDLHALMREATMPRPALLGLSEGGPMSLLFAATFPEKVEKLILFGSMARFCGVPDYPLMPGIESHAKMVEAWGTGASIRMFAPSLGKDDYWRERWAKIERTMCSPGDLRKQMETSSKIDVRGILGSVQVPTLVMHWRGDKAVPVENARFLAAHIPNAKLVELDGLDHAPWMGNTAEVLAEIREFLTGARGGEIDVDRVLGTLLFTDIVGSTRLAAQAGDAAWRERLDAHDRLTSDLVKRYRGQIVKRLGDGTLALFDGPARAIGFGLAVRRALDAIGMPIRAGVHTGEIERRGDDVAGLAVHAAQRIQAEAEAGEVLVSRVVTELAIGADFEFAPRGERVLKGLDGSWQLFSARDRRG